METKLEIKPFVKKDGLKYKIIQITDFTLHARAKQPTKSIGEKIQQAFDSKKPGRIYAPLQSGISLDILTKDPDFVKMVQEEEKNGYKVLISLPKAGIPVLPGKDTLEFLESKNGQRAIRGLAKNKPRD